MNGTRVWNRKYQVASAMFHKKEKILFLQGMIHWACQDFFRYVQDKINACKGIILKEDTGYLEPANILALDDTEFDQFCSHMKCRDDTLSDALRLLMGLYYQWDTLQYPGPPRALCVDVSWHEAYAFDRYLHVTAHAGGHDDEEYGLEKSAWDMLTHARDQGSVLLNALVYRCFAMLDRQSGAETKSDIMELILEWSETHRFKNPKKAADLYHGLVCHFGSDFDEMEPEHKAFLFDKREARVFKLIEKIERLDYVNEMLVIYGAGHFDALARGFKAAGWSSHGSVLWTTAWTFVPYTNAAMFRALDAVAGS